jgi:hypothetical protein
MKDDLVRPSIIVKQLFGVAVVLMTTLLLESQAMSELYDHLLVSKKVRMRMSLSCNPGFVVYAAAEIIANLLSIWIVISFISHIWWT